MRTIERRFSEPLTRYRRTQRFGDYLMLLCVWLGACWLGWVICTAILAARLRGNEEARMAKDEFVIPHSGFDIAKGGRP